MGNFNKNWYEKHQRKEVDDQERAVANSLKVHRGKAAFLAAYPDTRWAHFFQEDEVLLPVMKRYTCIEPGYYCAYIQKPYRDYLKWDVVVNDGDDGYIRKRCDSEQEAKDALELLVSFAPACFAEIVDMEVGFQWD